MNNHTQGAVGVGELRNGDGGRTIRHICSTKTSLYPTFHGIISYGFLGRKSTLLTGSKSNG